MQIQKINNQQSFGMNLKAAKEGTMEMLLKNKYLSKDAINVLSEAGKKIKDIYPKDKDAFFDIHGKILYLYTKHEKGSALYRTLETEYLPFFAFGFNEKILKSKFVQKIATMAEKISKRYDETEDMVNKASDLL